MTTASAWAEGLWEVWGRHIWWKGGYQALSVCCIGCWSSDQGLGVVVDGDQIARDVVWDTQSDPRYLDHSFGDGVEGFLDVPRREEQVSLGVLGGLVRCCKL